MEFPVDSKRIECSQVMKLLESHIQIQKFQAKKFEFVKYDINNTKLHL